MAEHMRLLYLSFLWAAITIPAAGSDSWHQWRGPNRDGVSLETGLMQQWPAEGPSLAWKISGLGAGYSSVSVVGGKIFTMGDGPDSSLVIALDEATGKTIWSSPVGKPGGGGGYPGPRCTPTFDDGLVYAIGQYGDLVCLQAETGKEVWRKHLVNDFGGKMMSGWGYSESPLVDGGKLLCTPGGGQGTVVALDKKTGALVWRSSEVKDTAAYTSIVAAEIGGRKQYVQFTDSSVFGLNPDSGKLLWQGSRKGRTAVIPDPIVHQDHVYVTSGYGIGCSLFKISRAGEQFEAAEAYSNRVMVNHHGGVILRGDHLYGYSDGKGWTCQEFKTGEAAWAERDKLGKGSIAYADGRLYLRAESGRGTVVLIEPSPEGFVERGRFDQPDRSDKHSWPHPVIANGKLYLRDQGLLLCYEIKAR
jgi:outer membrane protein assembly factor BamB